MGKPRSWTEIQAGSVKNLKVLAQTYQRLLLQEIQSRQHLSLFLSLDNLQSQVKVRTRENNTKVQCSLQRIAEAYFVELFFCWPDSNHVIRITMQ